MEVAGIALSFLILFLMLTAPQSPSVTLPLLAIPGILVFAAPILLVYREPPGTRLRLMVPTAFVVVIAVVLWLLSRTLEVFVG
jgi:hypothetical protein